MGQLGGAHRSQLGDRDLEVGEDLQQVGLEGLVGPVEFVDQEDRGDSIGRIEGGEQGATDEEVLGEDVAGEIGAALLPPLGRPDMDHLLRVVPLVRGRRQIQPLVALQANQRTAEPGGQGLGHLGLADTGFTLEE